MRHGLGWKPDVPDIRDLKYNAASDDKVDVASLPPKVDLSSNMASPAWNQLDLGSCTGQTAARLVEYNYKKQARDVFKPSPLFIYYNTRLIEGTVLVDAGAELRNVFKSVGSKGVCPEDDWPYIIENFDDRPTVKAYANALPHRATIYKRVKQTLPQIQACLAAEYPIGFGFAVYESIDDKKTVNTGIIQMPGPGENLEGGHAVVLCGYDDATSMFKGLNSWGTEWGDHGYFHMPYEYVLNEDLASDFWTIRLVS